MYAIVTEVAKGIGKKSLRPYHMFQLVVQDADGNVGTLKHFLEEQDQARPDWLAVLVGDVLEIEVEERRSGLNTYQNVAQAKISTKKAVITAE